MAWKIEWWLAEVFPGEEAIYSEYRGLSPRELAIVSAAVLDVALAELLSLRLVHDTGEIEDFLGLNGDGRAPVGSFGARIQLALLLGILTGNDAAILRKFKTIRNLFAHRAKVSFLSPAVVKALLELHALWVERSKALAEAGAIVGSTGQLEELRTHIPNIPEAGEGLLLSIFTVYQAYFHRMHSRMTRIEQALQTKPPLAGGGSA